MVRRSPEIHRGTVYAEKKSLSGNRTRDDFEFYFQTYIPRALDPNRAYLNIPIYHVIIRVRINSNNNEHKPGGIVVAVR